MGKRIACMWQKIKNKLNKKIMYKPPENISNEYLIKDPFPSIPPALLNSADIKSYVETTGMLDPFYDADLKSSSYAVRMKGRCKWWDEKGKMQDITLDQNTNKRFKLLPNSIAFIELEPKFKLPEYIAVRFNLKIKNVYRGLLLGTGPLIDPGFEGKVFIPLHNLTANEYIFEYNEELVWFEFTKTSAIPEREVLSEDIHERNNKYNVFPENKKNKNLDDYLDSASKGKSIISSIPDAIKDSKENAEKARKSVSLIKNIGIAAAAALILTGLSVIISAWSMQQEYIDKVQALEVLIKDNYINTLKENDKKSNDILTSLVKTATKVDLLEAENKDLYNNIDELNKCIKYLNNKDVRGGECEI